MKILDNIKKNTIFLLLVTGIILYIVLKDDFNGIVTVMSNIDIRYVLVAIIFYFLSIFLKGFANYLIINDKSKINLKEAVKHNMIAHFFNGVTPALFQSNVGSFNTSKEALGIIVCPCSLKYSK